MKKTAKTYYIILTVLFLAFIGICFLNDFFLFYKVPEIFQSENRKPTEKPLFDINKLDPYPKLYENYFNDQFPFRKDLFLINSLLCYYMFNQTPLPGEVELGKHGWLFFDQKESVVYNGTFTLTDADISLLVKQLHEQAVDYAKKGIRFYIAFPPIKPEIYPENLPVDFRRSPKGTVTERIVKAIKQDSLLKYIDIKEALLRAKGHGRLFNLTDNHWNAIGAFYGYEEIINTIRKDFPAIKPVKREDVSFSVEKRPPGNLATMIGLYDYLSEIQYIPKVTHSRTTYLNAYHKAPDYAANVEDYELVRSTNDSTSPNMVIIRDSFTNAMMPYLDESFDSVTYIFDAWRYGRNEAVIDDFKPDCVLLIIFEPHISHLIGK